MALSSGSYVSEDVWTLIKMCRASGRFFLPFPPPLFSLFTLPLQSYPSPCNFFLRGVCVRLLKRSKSVTWTAAGWVIYVRGVYATRGCVVISCHRLNDHQPTTDWSIGFRARSTMVITQFASSCM